MTETADDCPLAEVAECEGHGVFEMITFRPIPGFPHYHIDCYGRVWSNKRKRMLSPSLVSGYETVDLYRCNRLVHKLVLLAFKGPRPKKLRHCCHYDGNKLNSFIGNLRYDTALANKADSARHGAIACGRKIHAARLSPKIVRAIRSSSLTQREQAAKYGVWRSTIQCVLRRDTWKHVQ